jgi:thymidylate kinase
MKIVLAYEGMDGSGKSSLAVFTKRLCEQHGQRFTLIGRRESYSSPLVGRLSRLLHEEAASLTPAAETLIRVAREQERACLAAAAPAGLVVLDRFVLSSLSLVRFHGQDVEPVLRHLRDVIARAQLHATVFVKCPFEVARKRVKERQTAPPKRSRDDRFLRRLAETMEDDFQHGVLTGQQWLVDNSDSREAAEEQLSSYLAPYLQKGQKNAEEP